MFECEMHSNSFLVIDMNYIFAQKKQKHYITIHTSYTT